MKPGPLRICLPYHYTTTQTCQNSKKLKYISNKQKLFSNYLLSKTIWKCIILFVLFVT